MEVVTLVLKIYAVWFVLCMAVLGAYVAIMSIGHWHDRNR